MAHSEASEGSHSLGSRRTRGLPGGVRYSGWVALSESTRRVVGESPGEGLGVSSGTDGELGGIRRDSPGMGHSETRGGLGKYPGGEVLLLGTRDRCHFPKDSPEGVSTEVSKGHSAGLRDGFERAYRSGFGDTCRLPKGLRRVFRAGRFERVSGGGIFR